MDSRCWWNIGGKEIRGRVYRTNSGRVYSEVHDEEGHIYWNDFGGRFLDQIEYTANMVGVARSAVAHGLVIKPEDQLLVDVNREIAHA